MESLTRKEFEKWVIENYKGKLMDDPPENLDQKKELYYRINGLQYGPISIKHMPECRGRGRGKI